MKASHCKYILEFKRPGGTSRGVLTTKETHFLLLREGAKWGLGECGLFRGLSYDDRPGYEEKLQWVCENITEEPDALMEELREWPSIGFGLEQALMSLAAEDPMVLFPSGSEKGFGIPINGLVWMGDPGFMRQQVKTLLASGFRCLKLKIGALDFGREVELLEEIRKDFPKDKLELRVDANGAFAPEAAMEKLRELAKLGLHSIEQPIAAGQWEAMGALCRNSPLPIALDEELIGITEPARQKDLLETVRPQYIILKPSLLGGFRASEHWIRLAGSVGAEWWVTSALESNIGLNAIARWTATLENPMPQGLGTGSLFTNNFESPMVVRKGYLKYDPSGHWNRKKLKNLCT